MICSGSFCFEIDLHWVTSPGGWGGLNLHIKILGMLVVGIS